MGGKLTLREGFFLLLDQGLELSNAVVGTVLLLLRNGLALLEFGFLFLIPGVDRLLHRGIPFIELRFPFVELGFSVDQLYLELGELGGRSKTNSQTF